MPTAVAAPADDGSNRITRWLEHELSELARHIEAQEHVPTHEAQERARHQLPDLLCNAAYWDQAVVRGDVRCHGAN